MINLKRGIQITLLSLITISLWNCGDDGVVLFSIEDDKMLGMRTDSTIEADPSFVILDENQYSQAYAYLDAMKQEILNSGQVKYKDEFNWELHIIHDDETLNAFATPGGYIYIYTGLIKYLDDAASLAGVLGHEIAHADKRHSSKQMQKQYGVQVLLGVLLGDDKETLSQVVGGLIGLQNSRSHETEADESSVEYLCGTDFEADGASNFFAKIESEGGSNTPAFLSTHPSPDKRVENIRALADSKECGTQLLNPLLNNMTYDQFIAILP